MIPGLELLSPLARALVDPAVAGVDLLGDPGSAQPVGLDLDADLADRPTGLPASLRGLTPQPAPEALEAPMPSLPATPHPPSPRPLWLRRQAELAAVGSDATEVLEGEPASGLATLPPVSYRSPGPARIRVPLETNAPAPIPVEVEVEVELEDVPDPVPPISVPKKSKVDTVLEKLDVLLEARPPSVREVLDAHERQTVAVEVARVEAEYRAKNRAEWSAWFRVQLTRAFAAISAVAIYVWGRPDTREILLTIYEIVSRGEP